MRIRSVLISALFLTFAGLSSLVQAQEAGETVSAPAAQTGAAETPTSPAEKAVSAPTSETAEQPAAQPNSATPAPAALPAPETAAPAPEANTVRRPGQRRGMLPLGYRDFVTKDQREQIYEIQKKYRPRMEELEKEMDALRSEMMQEIQTILTPEQRQKIQARENEMRAKRGLKKQAK